MIVAKRLLEITPSAPLALMQKAAALREQGRSVISLGAGEPDFETPQAARDAAHAAIEAGATHYTACAGEKSLREAICAKLERDNQLRYRPDEVVVSNGAKQALYNAFLALLDPGDVVVIPSPYWVTYPEAARLVGAVPRLLPTAAARGFRIDPDALDGALRGARLLIFNSPSNPTGAVHSRAEIEALCAVIARHDCWVVTDEIYEKLVFDGAAHVSLPAACPALRERTIVVNGLSKAYAMTGWRMGYAAGPRAAIAALDLVQSHTTSNACSISQRAAEAALLRGDEDVRPMVAAFARRRRLVLDALAQVEGLALAPPQGAFYVFPDVSPWLGGALADGAALCERLLEEEGVAAVAGAAFGAPSCIRLSYATSDALLAEALQRVVRFLRRLPRA